MILTPFCPLFFDTACHAILKLELGLRNKVTRGAANMQAVAFGLLDHRMVSRID